MDSRAGFPEVMRSGFGIVKVKIDKATSSRGVNRYEFMPLKRNHSYLFEVISSK